MIDILLNRKLAEQLRKSLLTTNCEACCGICCKAFYFSKIDGFPYDKPSGVSCKNLLSDHHCKVHDQLAQLHYKGCIAFDCMGAGNRTYALYSGIKQNENEMFQVFNRLLQITQLLSYLLEALQLNEDQFLQQQIIDEVTTLQIYFQLTPAKLLEATNPYLSASPILDAVWKHCSAKHHQHTHFPFNSCAKNFHGKRIAGADFSKCLLIQSDFSKAILIDCCFYQADLRDVNLCDCDMRGAIFLTQAQINAAIGDQYTRLPMQLYKPLHWGTV